MAASSSSPMDYDGGDILMGDGTLIDSSSSLLFRTRVGKPSDGYVSPYVWLQQTSVPSVKSYDSIHVERPISFLVDNPPLQICSWDSIHHEVQNFLDKHVPKETTYQPDTTRQARIRGRRSIALEIEKLMGKWLPISSGFCGGIGVIGSPDFSMGWTSSRRCLLVGVAELPSILPSLSVDQIAASFANYQQQGAPQQSEDVVAIFSRLLEHMILSKTIYGFVTTGDITWFCTNVVNPRTLAISRPMSREHATMAYFWYLLFMGLQQGMQQQQKLHSIAVSSSIPAAPPPCLDKSIELKLKSKVRSLASTGINGMTSRSLHEKLKFWNLSRDFQLGGPVRTQRQRVCSILYAAHKKDRKQESSYSRVILKVRDKKHESSYGRVVLKVRDLGNCKESFDQHLKSFVHEILAYKYVRAFQGKGVPHLQDFGFASGFMLGVLVLSDGGCYHEERLQGASNAAVQLVKDLHAAGVYHGHFDHSDVLVTRTNPLSMTLVGFSRAGLISAGGVTQDDVEFEEKRVMCICREDMSDDD